MKIKVTVWANRCCWPQLIEELSGQFLETSDDAELEFDLQFSSKPNHAEFCTEKK